MGSSTRQFKALMRKNWINWKRSPKCSFCELCCSSMVFLLLVWIRTIVKVTTYDLGEFASYRHPVLPTLWKEEDGTWSGRDSTNIDDQVQPFMTYNRYPTNEQDPTGPAKGPYVSAIDMNGFSAFVPSQCKKSNSFQVERVESPIIATVGDETEPAFASMKAYMVKLVELQKELVAQLPEKEKEKLEYPDFEFRNWATREDLFAYLQNAAYQTDDDHKGVCYGFELTKNGDKSYTTTLFFNDQTTMGGQRSVGIPNQQTPVWSQTVNQPDIMDYEKFSLRGYSYLQNLAANIVLKEETGIDSASIAMMTLPEDPTNTKQDDFATFLAQLLPFMMLLMYIPPVYNTVFLIVREKESRIKESMRMMGMTDWPYWFSWFVYFTCINTVITTIAWLIMCINVIGHSNIALVWLFMWLYGQAVFGEIMFLQSLFSTAKYSGIVGSIIYFGGYLLLFPVQQPTAPYGMKCLLSLIPQVAMQLTAENFANYEGSFIGVQFSNMYVTVNNYSYLVGLVMLIFAFWFWLLLGLYLDAVLPKTYGDRLPVFFCCMRKYCCGGGNNVEERRFDAETIERRSTLQKAERRETLVDPFELKYLKRENYEPVAPEVARLELQDQFLKISDLTKVYDNGFKAVNGVNLKMYSGQIFALLGHNGAGKSTTISMLTGLLSKSTGEAQVYQNDLFREMQQVRQYLGVCPQHDVLFDNLTPEEHLDIFYDFKGGDPRRKRAEITDLIRDVSLGPDKRKMAVSLSGGNRRKLSVSIALCGGSKLVLFDEPTAGMDLGARRSLWDMLKNYKRDKIIILTTHYMDEADVLGDRIGIMAEGKILCLGTSLFLKDRYGSGYKLTIVKKSKKQNTAIQPFIESHLGKVAKLSEVSSEITFKLEADKASQFQEFFEEFDRNMDRLDIMSYGISMTTLEEVFLKSNEMHREEDDTVAGTERVDQLLGEPQRQRDSSINKRDGLDAMGGHMAGSSESQTFEPNKDAEYVSEENLVAQGSICDNITAVIAKRMHIYKRDKTGLICEIIVPIVLVILGLALTKLNVLKDSGTIPLVPTVYPSPQRILMNQNLISDTPGNITPKQLYDNLPDATTMFELTQTTTTDWAAYVQEVFDQQYIGDRNPPRFGSYLIYQADEVKHEYQFNTYLNTTSLDVTAYYPQFMYESILKTAAGVTFTVDTVPFPVFFVFATRLDQSVTFSYAFLVAIAIALIPCTMVSYILREREQQLKHMQVVSGMSLTGYWIANILSDIVKCYVPMIFIFVLSALFEVNDPGVWVILMLFPWAIVPFSYMTSFIFTSDTVAQIMTLFLHFCFGGVLSITVITLQLIPQTCDTGDKLRWWFCLVPSFPVTHAILWGALGETLIQVRALIPEAKPLPQDNWAFENLLGDAVALIIHFFVGVIVLAVIETNIFACLRKLSFRTIPARNQNLELDDDVLNEEERVLLENEGKRFENSQVQDAGVDEEAKTKLIDSGNTPADRKKLDVVSVHNFRKAYTTLLGEPFLAVERISFGLDYGECFALLGVNGAGKTTTFKSLTKDIEPTEGTISIAGYNVSTQFSEARKLIGYCPQHDSIFVLMTVEEHLWFYGKIKGIPAQRRREVIERAIEELNLSEHRSKPAGTLSGGNKRKLSVAIAILGNPPIILLDEPSAGMDPEARRFMWQVVEKISQRDKKSAVILTTHSMEEAEALSTKMGIMVRGGIFRCYGSSQHIKNKFGVGYEIEIKIQKPKIEDLEKLARQLKFIDLDSDRSKGDEESNRVLDHRINLQDAIKQCNENEFNDQLPLLGLVVDQIRMNGLGVDLAMEEDLDPQRQVRLQSLVQFLYTQQYGFRFIEFLSKQFAQVELLEQCSDFYKIRVPKEDKTIGYLFGQIEGQKEEYGIAEYGVSQTSLEQIFQNFAQQSVDDKAAFTFRMSPLDQLILLNPDRKSTMLQRRESSKGLRPEIPEEERIGTGTPKDFNEKNKEEIVEGKLIK